MPPSGVVRIFEGGESGGVFSVEKPIF